MELYHIILTILAIVWLGGGPVFYMSTLNRVKLLPQKIVMLILAGPLTWLAIPLVYVADLVIVNLFKWLYKE
jgi:hypothetical protein